MGDDMSINKAGYQIDDKVKYLQEEYNQYIDMRKKLRPKREACKILLLYLLVGSLWILLSDKILHILVSNPESIKVIQLYKGWFYVIITGIIFYLIIKRRMDLFDQSIIEILKGYEELSTTHEELIAMNDEMDAQNSELENNRRMLHHMAYNDSLTGLPNRSFFEKEVIKLIEDAMNTKLNFTLVYLDIDDFKHINDTLGHNIGDCYIKHTGAILARTIKKPHIVARLGGDEFAILLYDVCKTSEITSTLDLVLGAIRKPWDKDGKSYFVSVSMGVAVYPDHGRNFTALMQNIDIAMFHRKENGKDGYTIYEPSMANSSLNFIQMSNQLRKAINQQEFQLYYQPQYNLESGEIIGVEALIRWLHPEKGFISPMEFIPFSEKTGFIVPISEWVFETACKQKAEWNKVGHKEIKMAINLSGYMITEDGLIDQIKSLIETYNLNPNEIELEVTETAVMTRLDKAKLQLQALKELGVSIALDDFGTGYSSLTYLQTLPFDILKIDREFIKNVAKEDEERYIFKAIVELAHNLDLQVVAEGVETIEQNLFLQNHKCDIGQGYYFSRPIPGEDVVLLFGE
jgi:diguanylate cyclase (GGDEF)-like protein